MGSQRGVTKSIGETQAQTHIPNHDTKSNHPLARQGSLYGITFAEMENQLGDLEKPLSSMNLHELLKTIFTAEANNSNQPVVGADLGPSGQQPGQPALLSSRNRQPSMSLSHGLSKKTVHEVWHDIQQNHASCRLDRKVALGEMTLEEFLVKAGVVSRKNNLEITGGVDSTIGLSQQAAQWMSYPFPSVYPQQWPQTSMLPIFGLGHAVQQAVPNGGKLMMESYPENQITMSSSPIIGSSLDTQKTRRKRAPHGVVEKSVERRQKRMIKNRESAARSRAKKQAYTHELENKVSRLEEENERLKRQQEREKVLPIIPRIGPKYQLRRTSSAPL